MNRRSKTFLIAGMITLFVSVISMMICVKDWFGIRPLAAAFVVLVEAGLFGGLALVERMAVNTEQVLFRTSCYVVIPAYAAVSCVLSLIFLSFLPYAAVSYIVLQMLIMAIAMIILLAFYSFSISTHRSNTKTLDSVMLIDSFVKRLDSLASTCGSEAYALTLKQISEDLRFTDTSSRIPLDAEIDLAISALEAQYEKDVDDRPAEAIDQALTALHALVSKRKIEVAALRKGRI